MSLRNITYCTPMYNTVDSIQVACILLGPILTVHLCHFIKGKIFKLALSNISTCIADNVSIVSIVSTVIGISIFSNLSFCI